MPKRFVALWFLILLSPLVSASAQTPHVAVPLNRVMLLSLTCSASQNAVVPGGTVTIQAQGTSFQGLLLQYSFAASAGQLEQKGSFAELHTKGLAPQVVHVTCSVSDTQGRRVSHEIVVTVSAVKIESGTIHLPGAHAGGAPPPAPPPPKQTEIAHPAPVTAPPVAPVSPPTAAPVAPPKHTETAHPAAPVTAPVAPPVAPPKAAQGTGAGTGSGAPAAQPPVEQPSPSPGATQPESPGAAQPESPGAAQPDEYKQAETVAQWVEHLRQGMIEYKVPTSMTLQVPSTVTVVIHGYEDTNTKTLNQPTGGGTLKQSERMKVELLAPDNPGAFTIVPQGSSSVQFVPINGATTWMWSVTPNTAGNNLKIEVRASVIYPGGDDKTEQQVETYDATVAVHVQSFWTTVKDYVQEHPLQVFGYMIPGGAGFTFLAGLAVWWWKRRQKDDSDDEKVESAGRSRQRKRRS